MSQGGYPLQSQTLTRLLECQNRKTEGVLGESDPKLRSEEGVRLGH